MSTPIPTGPTDLPDERALNTAQPASGRAMAALYSALMQGLGFDWLRFATMPIQSGDWATSDRGTDSTIAANPTHYLRFTPSPLARYIWVGVQCSYHGGGVSTATVSVETAAGGVVDSGVIFRSADLVQPGVNNALDPATGARVPSDGGLAGLVSVAHTGWATGLAASTTARMLDIDGYQGQDLVLKLDVASVRPYALMYIEAYRREV
jgi:hypothetical protein